MKKFVNQIKFIEYEDVEIVSGTCIHSFPIHIHRGLCIGIITDGYASFVINGEKMILTPGDGYIVPPYNPHALSSIANKEFSYSVLCIKNVQSPLFTEDYISNALNFITNESSWFSLESLANAVHISKFHFGRKFKEQIGITPYQFYLNEKIKKSDKDCCRMHP